MKTYGRYWRNPLLCLGILGAAFAVSLLLQHFSPSPSVVSMVFVLAVFLIALSTRGYLWGVIASFISVLVDNFVFTFPYLRFSFLDAESLLSALVLLIVTAVTGTLTTKLKQQERLRAETEREKMRGNLLRAISHDLRTPLTTIYGASSVIVENFDTLSRENQLRLTRQVQEDSQSLIRMVENLLSVTRVNDESVRVSKLPTVLEELVDAVLQKFTKSYPRQRVTVTIPEEFISIPMDAMLIRQVLINLLENAVLHAEGMTELSLTVYTREGRAWFEVADNGCGIPRSRMDTLFTGQFYEQNTPTDSGRAGMGIGLSVCATILKAHGGGIEAENRKAGGACFRFWLEMENNSHEQQ